MTPMRSVSLCNRCLASSSKLETIPVSFVSRSATVYVMLLTRESLWKRFPPSTFLLKSWVSRMTDALFMIHVILVKILCMQLLPIISVLCRSTSNTTCIMSHSIFYFDDTPCLNENTQIVKTFTSLLIYVCIYQRHFF